MEIGFVLKMEELDAVLDLVFFVGCSPTITDPMIDYIGEVTSKFDWCPI